MLYKNPCEVILDDVFVSLEKLEQDLQIYLKLECFNLAGSIKLKPALAFVQDLERRGILTPNSRIIESSSGNLGVALAIVSKVNGYPFTCVTDPNASPHNLRLIAAYSGEVIVVKERDENGGYLRTRIRLIESLLSKDPSLVWTNQYANPVNKDAHRIYTAAAIHRQFQNLDYLFVGTGSSGTLMGCAEYMKQHSPHTRVIGVDSVGSVTFGFAPAKRHIPGIGASRRPEIFDPALVDDVVMIPEAETVAMCRRLRDTCGILAGGSTGTVVAGVMRYKSRLPRDATVVAISSDLGEHYIDTIYDDVWVQEKFPHVVDLCN
ncbi:MAG: 2,3-diaminopropionate biosynthesis protein SbnA [Gammaproteobacteria bacterium]|nr:2,3-diaminopropionate biosynthesis protein SbnA [Gammaproteobacteria bacterium]